MVAQKFCRVPRHKGRDDGACRTGRLGHSAFDTFYPKHQKQLPVLFLSQTPNNLRISERQRFGFSVAHVRSRYLVTGKLSAAGGS